MFLDRVIHFGENLGDKERVRSPKKLNIFIEFPNVHVLSFNMILLSSPWRVPRPSSKLQYDPYHISVACSHTELSISEEIWAIR